MTEAILTDISTDVLLEELSSRLTTTSNELISIADKLEQGDSFAHQKLTKKDQGIIKRFKRDHTVFNDALHKMYSIAAEKWASDQLIEERHCLSSHAKDLSKRETRLEKEKQWIRKQKHIKDYYGLQKEDWTALRAALHPDKHINCSSSEQIQHCSQLVNRIVQEIKQYERTMNSKSSSSILEEFSAWVKETHGGE